MTITDLAAHVGVHKSTVSRQVAAAGLRGADGKVDVDAYQALREGGLDPALQTAGAAAAAPDDVGVPAQRARKMAADAEMAELELARMRGELVPRALVAEVLGPLLTKLRDDLVGIPGDVLDDPGLAAKCSAAIAEKLRRVSDDVLAYASAPPRG
jgi:hypothetical protein